MSSTKIGGPHRCNIHPDFPETDDVNEWNKHCQETEGHTVTGVVSCTNCGNSIDLNDIPYQPIGQELKLQCVNCYNKTQDLNKLVIERFQNAEQITVEETQGGNNPQ